MSESEAVGTSSESELPEELKIAIDQQVVASETPLKRLQAVHANGMISDESMSAIIGWSERLARTTAHLNDAAEALAHDAAIVATQDGSQPAQAV